MPFRPVRAEVTYGKPELLVQAQAGDAELQVCCTAFGAGGAAVGPNYIVGVKQDDGTVAGKYVTDSGFATALADGDELWVAAAEDLSFASSILITGLVRSVALPASRACGR